MQENPDLFVARNINGAEARFGKLTPRDRAGILRRIKADRKALLLANLQAAGLEKEQVLVELEHFDDRPWGQVQWLNHLNTIDGQEEVVRTAYTRCNTGDPVPIIHAIESAEGGLLTLSAELCNLRVVRPAPKSKSPEPEAVPRYPLSPRPAA